MLATICECRICVHGSRVTYNMHELAFATSIRIPTVVIFFGPMLQRFEQELPRA